MRALLGMVLFSMVGCDALWGGYVGNTDLATACSAPGGCDMASSDLLDAAMPDSAMNPPDLQPGDCLTTAQCSMPNPYCDLNTNRCVATAPPTDSPFLTSNMQSQPVGGHFALMAIGDYDGDGVNDVAVSGVFPNGAASPLTNASTATANVPVEAYLSARPGALLTKDTSTCALPAAEAPVYLLTVPGSGVRQDLLVATYSGAVYRCTRTTTGWGVPTAVTVKPYAGQSIIGFKQMALATHEGPTATTPTVDLVIRTSSVLFTDSVSGDVIVHRPSGGNNFNGLAIRISDSNMISALPYRFAGATVDTLATTWAGTATHPGVEFHYVNNANSFTNPGSGNTAVADVAGTMTYPELNVPLSAMATFKVRGQTGPSILFTYSQKSNSVTLLYGADVPSFGVQAQKTNLAPLGLMLPYAGDANEDGQDEIGLYTLALNGTAIARHLMLYAYTPGTTGVIGATPLFDLPNATENYRGMALEYLGAGDKPKQAHRKDLIALIENPSGSSRLLVMRPDLNYVY